ncbi:hypothetical protein [Amycolatopsis sp. cmx-8-4]|uniref:hypothetical protein n=1 Tax=Amycolatopsis sp. cmx-8-4 TaxID=2790947 RepID=UPI00397A85EF
MEFHGVTIEPPDLEAPLDDVTPAEHHLLLVLRKRRLPPRDELLDDGTAVAEPVLEREVVDGEDGRAFVQVAKLIGSVDQPRVQVRPELGL